MTKNIKKIFIKTVPYVLVGLIATNIGEAMRLSTGKDASEKMLSFFTDGLGAAFTNMMPLCFYRILKEYAAKPDFFFVKQTNVRK